jgi:hypothetical protein
VSETEELALAQFAASILRDERWTQFVQSLRDRYTADWLKATDPSLRELAWHRTKVLDELIAELRKAEQRPAYTETQRSRLTDSSKGVS